MSKTLNEDDVLKEIDRWIGYLDEDMITRIKIGIKKLPSAQQEHATCYLDSPCEYQNVNITLPSAQVLRWIPVTERLPKEKINPNTQDYDWVLCSTTFGDVRAYHFGRGRFLHGCGDVTQYVTAWMPLPEPTRMKER